MSAGEKVLIAGIAEGFGLALAQTFAETGQDILGLARSARVAQEALSCAARCGRAYRHIEADLAEEESLRKGLSPDIERIGTAIVIAQHFCRAPFLETGAQDWQACLATNCLGAVHLARMLLPPMLMRGSGTLIFVGATASLRGGNGFAALAASKFALRALAQSLAREFGPRGIHVAHLVIDGPIDTPQTDQRFPGRHVQRIAPESLARTCLMLARQPADCFTLELDLRPSEERF